MRDQDVIIVAGSARSGVSMVGGLLGVSGAWGGFPAGQTVRESFESREARRLLLEPFLRGLGADPRGQHPLPDPGAVKAGGLRLAATWARRFERIVRAKGYAEGPIYVASSLSLLCWPAWVAALPRARWLLVRRDDDDTVRACMKTRYMDAHGDENGWRAWVAYHNDRFAELRAAAVDWREVWPHRMIQGRFREMRDVALELHLDWDPQAAEDFMAPVLWQGGVFEATHN